MERCDFSSVMTIIRRFISDDYNTNQTELLEDVFSSFFNQPDDPGAFDMALVCRWFTGQAKISPKISQFYAKFGNRKKLAADLEDGVLPLMYDSAMAAQEVHRLLMQDDTISERVKKERSRYYPCDSEYEEALLIADVLCFAMECEFIKRDPKVKNFLADENFLRFSVISLPMKAHLSLADISADVKKNWKCFTNCYWSMERYFFMALPVSVRANLQKPMQSSIVRNTPIINSCSRLLKTL